ncbi:hypothetical protein VTK73DRAFT_2008 [Phialemonium thermophilum]|uniref:Post-SET domain-containing protein n=1 Tax=Phialemonium thermophilum TaxID=223376 RepID=A0ABR3X7K7_9PEZI
MAPLIPHWTRPSHPDIQEVIINEAEFTSKSLSKVALPPFAVYAKMSFPPCTIADEPTYATVQISRDKHLNLNSDLLYINHSCDPSLIFDTTNFDILVGPKGLKPGDELTFFYPSTEWEMAQPFDCLCGAAACRGRISGAKHMTDAQLEGVFLNGHIRALLAERKSATGNGGSVPQPAGTTQTVASEGVPFATDPATKALNEALKHAEEIVVAVRSALLTYTGHAAEESGSGELRGGSVFPDLRNRTNGFPCTGAVEGSQRRGPTSRELSGEMGGDTVRT